MSAHVENLVTSLTVAQLQTLRHMLGIDVTDRADPVPYRDYYAAALGDPELIAMEQVGAVTCFHRDGHYDWYRCTDAGRAAAIVSQRNMLEPKAQRRYARFLEVADAHPGLTFRDFLTSPLYERARQG